MKPRTLLVRTRGVLLLVLAPALTWGIDRKSELYVINTRPPSVALVDAAEWKVQGSVPLAPEPTYAVIGPDNRFLYVLHKGLYRPEGFLAPGIAQLSVVDVGKREVVRRVPLAWNVTSVALAANGRYLLCVSQGKEGKKKAKEEYGSVTIVDTRTNDVAATLSAGRSGVVALMNADLSRIAVLNAGEPAAKKGEAPSKARLTIFTIDHEQPISEIEFDAASDIAMSPDREWAFVLDRGRISKKPGETRPSVVHVVNLDSAQLAADFPAGYLAHGLRADWDTNSVTLMAQASATDPAGRVFRFRAADPPQSAEAGSGLRFLKRSLVEPGLFAFGYEDVRFLPDSGALSSEVIPLNPKTKDATALSLGGIPGDVIYLPESRRIAMTVRTLLDIPTSKVAIVNVAENRIERVVTTGRGSVKFGKYVGAVALSAATSGVSYYSNLRLAQATGSPYFFYNIYAFSPGLPDLELTASTDGRFVYALNRLSNDVTVIDTHDGSAVQKIPVGGGCRRIASAPNGRFIYSFTGGQVDLIDTETNQKRLEYHVEDGHVRNVTALPAEATLVALTSKSLVVIDLVEGRIAHTVAGFGEPWFLVERTPSKAAN